MKIFLVNDIIRSSLISCQSSLRPVTRSNCKLIATCLNAPLFCKLDKRTKNMRCILYFSSFVFNLGSKHLHIFSIPNFLLAKFELLLPENQITVKHLLQSHILEPLTSFCVISTFFRTFVFILVKHFNKYPINLGSLPFLSYSFCLRSWLAWKSLLPRFLPIQYMYSLLCLDVKIQYAVVRFLWLDKFTYTISVSQLQHKSNFHKG